MVTSLEWLAVLAPSDGGRGCARHVDLQVKPLVNPHHLGLQALRDDGRELGLWGGDVKGP